MHHSTAFAASVYPPAPRSRQHRQKSPANDHVQVVLAQDTSPPRWQLVDEVHTVGKPLRTETAQEEQAEVSLGYYDILDDYDPPFPPLPPSLPQSSVDDVEGHPDMPKRRSLSGLVPAFILQSLNNAMDSTNSRPTSPTSPTASTSPARTSISRTHSRNPSAISMSTPSSPNASRLTFGFGSGRDNPTVNTTTTTTTTSPTTLNASTTSNTIPGRPGSSHSKQTRGRAYTTSAATNAYSRPASPISASQLQGESTAAMNNMMPPPIDYFSLPPPPANTARPHAIDAILHSLAPSSPSPPPISNPLAKSQSHSGTQTSPDKSHSRAGSVSFQAQPQPRKPSPPPAFLLDDDPFANLYTTPAVISSAASATGSQGLVHTPATKRPPPLVLAATTFATASAPGLPPTSPLHPSANLARSALHPAAAAALSVPTADNPSLTSNVVTIPPLSPNLPPIQHQQQPITRSISRPSSPPLAVVLAHIPSPSLPSSPNAASATRPFGLQPGAPPVPIVPRPQPVPASQRPAFRTRPSLPSLDTLARMNVVIKPRKPRKGKPGAGLPFEPWDNPDDIPLGPPGSASGSADSSASSSPSPSPSPTPTSSHYPIYSGPSPGSLSPGPSTSTSTPAFPRSTYSSPPSSRPTSPPPLLTASIASLSRPSSPPSGHRHPQATRPLLPSEIMSLGSVGLGVEDVEVLDLSRYPTIPVRSPRIQHQPSTDYMSASEAIVEGVPFHEAPTEPDVAEMNLSATPTGSRTFVSSPLSPPMIAASLDDSLPSVSAPSRDGNELSVVLEEGGKELEEAQADEARAHTEDEGTHLRPPNILGSVSPLQRLSRASSGGGVDPAFAAEAEGLHSLLFRSPSQGSLEKVDATTAPLASPLTAVAPPRSSSLRLSPSLLLLAPSRKSSRSSLARSPSRSPHLPAASPPPEVPLPSVPFPPSTSPTPSVSSQIHLSTLSPVERVNSPDKVSLSSVEAVESGGDVAPREDAYQGLESPPPLAISSPSLLSPHAYPSFFNYGQGYTTSPELQAYTPSLTQSSHPSSTSLSLSRSVSSHSRSSTSESGLSLDHDGDEEGLPRHARRNVDESLSLVGGGNLDLDGLDELELSVRGRRAFSSRHVGGSGGDVHIEGEDSQEGGVAKHGNGVVSDADDAQKTDANERGGHSSGRVEFNAETGVLLAKDSYGSMLAVEGDSAGFEQEGGHATLSRGSSSVRPGSNIISSRPSFDLDDDDHHHQPQLQQHPGSGYNSSTHDPETEFSYSERETDQDFDNDDEPELFSDAPSSSSSSMPIRSVTGFSESRSSSIPSSPPMGLSGGMPHAGSAPAKKGYFWFPSRNSVFSDMTYAPERAATLDALRMSSHDEGLGDHGLSSRNQLGLVLNGSGDDVLEGMNVNDKIGEAPVDGPGGGASGSRSHSSSNADSTHRTTAGYYGSGGGVSTYSASPYVSSFSQRRGGGDEDDDDDENRRGQKPRGLGGMGHAAEYAGNGGAHSRAGSTAGATRSRAASSSGLASASSDEDSTDDYGIPSAEPVRGTTNGDQRHRRHHSPQSTSVLTSTTTSGTSHRQNYQATDEDTSSATIMPPTYDTRYPVPMASSTSTRRVISSSSAGNGYGAVAPLPRYPNSHSTLTSPPPSATVPRYSSTASSSRRPSTSIPPSDLESSENDDDDDDDVPLAQRIPGALSAQKSIQRKVKEEREERRRAREAARARQLTLRPAGAGVADPMGGTMSSSQEAAAAAHAITATTPPHHPTRPRTQTLPGKSAQPFSAEDLSRKLQNVQLASTVTTATGVAATASPVAATATGLVSPDSFPQPSPQGYAFANGSGVRPRAKSISSRVANAQFGDMSSSSSSPSVPPLRSRSVRHPPAATTNSSPSAQPPVPLPSLRPMRSFHRPNEQRPITTAGGAPPPPPEDVPIAERRVGRSSTSASRSHKVDQHARPQRSLSLSRSHPSHAAASSGVADAFTATPDFEHVPPLPSRPSHDDHRKLLLKPFPDSAQRSARPSIDVDRPPKPSVQQLLSTAATTSAGVVGGGAAAAKTLTSQQRIFVGDMQRFNMVNVGPATTAQDVIDMIDAEGSLKGWVGSGGWMVFEVAKDFGMERPVRSFELLVDVQSSWLKDKTVNYFVLKLTPLSIPLSRSAIPQSSPTHSGYVEWEVKRGKWSKRWLQLREHSIWMSKRDNRRDEILLCSLSTFDAYHITRAHRAPKPFAFAIKSTDDLSLFENTADYLHSFSCAEKDGRVWLEKILIARSYVLYHERHVLFQGKGTPNSGANLSRSTTKKSPGSAAHRPLQPFIAMPGNDVFEPGSLLAKKL